MRVRELATQLRENGVDVRLDHWHAAHSRYTLTVDMIEHHSFF
jgi:hypothetical protein